MEGSAVKDCEGTCGGSAECGPPSSDGAWEAVPEGAKVLCFDWDAANPTAMM